MSPAVKGATTPIHRAIALDQIVPCADNPRKHFPADEMRRLADSLLAVGQLKEIDVRVHPTQKGKYEIAAGESRWRAAKLAGWKDIACTIHEMDDQKFYELLVWENPKHRPLKPLEEARGYELLLKKSEGWAGEKWTVERIAKDGGVSPDYIRDRLRLFKLAPAAAKLLEEGRIELGHALELAKLDSKQQVQAIEGGLFESADGQHSVLDGFEVDEEDEKAVTVSELKRYIDERIMVNLAHPELEHLLPDTAKKIAAARTEQRKQVFIALGYFDSQARNGEKVIAYTSWKRADGLAKSKPCDHWVLGVVAGGDAARGQAFRVCTAKEKCAVHWPDHVKRAKERKAQAAAPVKAAAKVAMNGTAKASASAAEAEKRRKDAEAKEAAARKAKAAAMEQALPAIEDAVLAGIAKVKPFTLLKFMIAEQEKRMSYELRQPENKRLLAKLPAKDLDGAVRRIFFMDMLFDENPFTDWGLENTLPGICKQFGIDLKKIVAAAMPAPAAEQKPKATKGKPAKKAAKKAAKKKAKS